MLRDLLPVAQGFYEDGHNDHDAQGVFLLKVRWLYANAIAGDTKSSTDDLREAVATLTSVEASWRRIFGPSHPETTIVEGALEDAQEALAARVGASAAPSENGPRETPSSSSGSV